MEGEKLYKEGFELNKFFCVQKSTGISFAFFAFFLPIETRVSNVFLIISLVLILFEILKSKRKIEFPERGKALVFTLFPLIILHFIGLIYSETPQQGLSYIERSLSFLLVPLVLLFVTKNNILYFRILLIKGLLIGASISLFILLSINLYNYFNVQRSFHLGIDLFDYYHTYLKFTKPLEQHPTYLGIYYLTAIIFIDQIIYIKFLKYLTLLFFGIGFLFLNSRIISGLFLIWVFYYFIRKINIIFSQKKYSKLIIIFVVVIIGFIATINVLSNSYIGTRIKNIYKFEFSSRTKVNFNSHSESNPRMARYISAYKLIKEKPIYGYGTTGEKINLKNQFILDGLTLAAEQNYNSHNQFIGFTIRYGVIGLLVLFFFFGSNIYLAWSTKNKEYMFFTFMIASVCLIENYLDRNYGITFSAVFFTVFGYSVLLINTE